MYLGQIVNYQQVDDRSAQEGWQIDIYFIFPLFEIYSEVWKESYFILDIIYSLFLIKHIM